MQNKKTENFHEYYLFLKDLATELTKKFKEEKKIKFKIYNKKISSRYDPVTPFDKLFETLIKKKIKVKYNKHSIHGEEYGRDVYKNSKHLWLLDPIDGTKSFIAGNPTWSNLIGLDINKVPVIGLANFPELDKFYINTKNEAFVFNKKKKIKIKVSKNNFQNIKIAGSTNCFLKYMKKKFIRDILDLIQFNSFDSLSIGNFCEGRVDAVIGCGNKSWDIHPWIPIIEKSGGIISNWVGKPVDTGGNILISNNQLNHKKILSKLKLIL
jgi:fructose-1,6-bisphosphatase/inositol monophosphatase family enzyme